MPDTSNSTSAPQFISDLGPWMESFIREKQACGFRYTHAAAVLKRLDRHWFDDGNGTEPSRDSMERFVAHRPHERPRNQLERYSVTRQFTLYLNRVGVPAWIPQERMVIVRQGDFVPYIFARDQLISLFDAADRLPMAAGYPHMPLILRLFYGCGLRLSEVIWLNVGDVDLLEGTLHIIDTKFGKNRRIPVALSLVERLRAHCQSLRSKQPDDPLFPVKTRRTSKRYRKNQIYLPYRGILSAAGIDHGGRGKGPRIHDLRHTFAVHRLESWYRQGGDVNAMLPLLVAYMGHGHMTGTQYYLRLTPAVFPDLVQRMEEYAGSAIPRGDDQ